MANKKPVEFYKQTQVLEKKPAKKVETDEILSGNDKLLFLLSQHWKKIAIGVGTIAAVIVVLVVVQYIRESQDLKLRQEFSDAKKADDPKALEALIKDNPDHAAAITARFKLAEKKAAAGNHIGAAETLMENTKLEEVDPYYVTNSRIRAAAFYEQGGKDGEARAIYIELMQDPDVGSEARYSAVRLSIKLGKDKDVEAYLESVKDEVSPEMNYWDIQLVNLKKRLAMEKVKFVAPKAPAEPAAQAPAEPAAPAQAPAPKK